MHEVRVCSVFNMPTLGSESGLCVIHSCVGMPPVHCDFLTFLLRRFVAEPVPDEIGIATSLNAFWTRSLALGALMDYRLRSPF